MKYPVTIFHFPSIGWFPLKFTDFNGCQIAGVTVGRPAAAALREIARAYLGIEFD